MQDRPISSKSFEILLLHHVTNSQIHKIEATLHPFISHTPNNMRRPYPFDQQSYAYEHRAYSNHYPPHPYYDYDYYYYSNLYPQFTRKRQRRQAAAIVVDSLWNNGSGNNNTDTGGSSTPARKSTAQPRPVLTIPPKGIGPIAEPNVNDVLCGRGGRINSHRGNVRFRDIINSKKTLYLAPSTKKLEKAHIAAAIVNDIRSMNPPGRFLKEEKGTGMWYDIGDAKAIKKTGQALREDAPEIRPAIDGEGGSSGDEKKPAKSNARSPQVSPHGQGRNTVDPQQLNQAPILPQQQGNAPDYQGQMAMPPPYSNNGYPSQQSSQQQHFQQQGFETRNIPIQMPLQGNQSSYPNQMYNTMQNTTNKFGLASKKAMEALNQGGQAMQPQYASYAGAHPDEVSFGIPFHEPANSRMISDDVTISTISGLSEPMGSVKSAKTNRTLGASELMNMSLKSSRAAGNSELMNMSLFSSRNAGNSELMNMSLKSNISLTDSLRLKHMRGNSNHNRAYDPLMPAASIRSGSRGSDFLGGSLTRSNSFPDNLNNESFRFDREGNEFGDDNGSLMGAGNRQQMSSGMSIGSIMDMQSNASSGQWFQAALGNLPAPDDKSLVSSGMMSTAMMSADLDALDLASPF